MPRRCWLHPLLCYTFECGWKVSTSIGEDVIMDEGFDWRVFIHSDPEILIGKPVIKGTRLSVELILRLFAAGWTTEQILDSYPTLTNDSLRAVFAYAAESAAEEKWLTLPRR